MGHGDPRDARPAAGHLTAGGRRQRRLPGGRRARCPGLRALSAKLVRVTVTHGGRRVDLVLPGGVPVAELLPGLARGMGVLSDATVHHAYHLMTCDGSVVAADVGLCSQGVEDGAVLALAWGGEIAPARVYDDVVEAVGDAVERELPPVERLTLRRMTLGSASVMLLVAAGSMLLVRDPHLAAGAAAGAATVLLLLGLVCSRAPAGAEVPLVLAVLCLSYAAVAGVRLGGGPFASQPPVVGAGVALTVAGVGVAVAVPSARPVGVPSVVTGAVLAVAGLVAAAGPVRLAVLLTTVLALVAAAGSAVPSLALALTGTTVGLSLTDPWVVDALAAVDPVEVAADARRAHQVILTWWVTLGALLLVVTPWAVSLGAAGAGVAVLSCLVTLSQTARYRAGPHAVVGLVGGALGLVSAAASSLWLHPEWRPGLSVAAACTGGLLLAKALGPGGTLVAARAADAVERLALVALLPALVLATDLLSSVGRWSVR